MSPCDSNHISDCGVAEHTLGIPISEYTFPYLITDFIVDDAHPNRKRTTPLEVTVLCGLTTPMPEEPEKRFSNDWTAVLVHTELRLLPIMRLLEIIL